MVKQINFWDYPESIKSPDGIDGDVVIRKNTSGFDLSINAVLILVQIICSCLAGVYNEYLLKDKGASVNIYIQNVYMYLDSIVCNLLLLTLQGDPLSALSVESLKLIFRFDVIIIMINNAAIGIVTSFFLKYLNSILKTFASALELIFTAIFCYLLFSIPIYLNTIFSIGIVSCAIYLYSQSPVVNTGKSTTTKIISKNRRNSRDEASVALLIDSDEKESQTV